MTLPGVFNQREQFVNYDWVDIANGTGYVEYYGALCNGGLETTTPRSTVSSEFIKIVNPIGGIANALTQLFNLDFDIEFNVPKNIKGEIQVNVPIGIANPSAVDESVNMQVIVKVYHFDGSTETQLGSTATSTLYSIGDLNSGGLARMSANALLKVTQATTKRFKAGEILRVTVEGWFEATTGANSLIAAIGLDPSNRPDTKEPSTIASNKLRPQIIVTGQPTRLSINVPFQLDI